MSFEYILHEMSFENFMMYNSVVPSYNTNKDCEDIDGDDPNNINKMVDFINSLS